MLDDCAKDNPDLEIIPPHALWNQLRACYRGAFTMEEAQVLVARKFGGTYQVLEVCPTQCLSDDPASKQLVAATEIIFARSLPNQLRIYCRGALTMKEAQAKLGSTYQVLEVCPAQYLSDDPASDQLFAATEVICTRT